MSNIETRIAEADAEVLKLKDALVASTEALEGNPDSEELLIETEELTAKLEKASKTLDALKKAESALAAKAVKVEAPNVIHAATTKSAPKDLIFKHAAAKFIAYAEKMSPLGNATALDCANYTVAMFSDLTKRVTLQNLYNDGGFSNMGVSDAVMEYFTEQ